MQNGIEVAGASFGYSKKHTILHNISLNLKTGSFVGIVGSNGSGKSTLTHLFNGLIPHSIRGHLTGEVFVDGISTKNKPVSYFASHVGMVFQNPDFSLFQLTAREELAFGVDNLKLDNTNERIVSALAAVGLASYIDRDPQTLSLGQKQKVALACVLALDTKYIVLDEPTAMLDYKSSLELYGILRNLNRAGKTIIVVEHDTDLLWQYASEVVIIDAGKIQARGLTRQVLTQTKLLTQFGIKVPNTAK